MAPKKTVTFQNTGYLKESFVATPVLTNNWCFQLVFFETNDIDVEQTT